MAKEKKVVKAVALVSPTGTRVTVAEASADGLKARGYKSAPTRPKAKSAPKSDSK